jgi:hypothetical protein
VHVIDERARSSAPSEAVFALLADGRTWPEWGEFDSVEVKGGPGVGEERFFKTGRVRNHERVVEFEPPRSFGYVSLSGLPVSDYRATVTLSAAGGGGTDIHWHSEFNGRYGLGRLVQRRLGKFIAQTAEALAREAERAGA